MPLIPSYLIALAFFLAGCVSLAKRHHENALPRFLAAAYYTFLELTPATPIEAARLYARYIWLLLPTVEVLWWIVYKWFRRRGNYERK